MVVERLPPSIPRNYVLVIAEKPRAAEKIAQSLSRGRAKRIVINGVPVWIVNWMGRNLVVAPAAGHLFTLHTDREGYPVFEYRWVPRYLVDKEAKHTKKFLEVLKLLCRYASEYVNACDYDVEGSLIGYLVIKHFGSVNRAKRAKFSNLTPQEIVKAFLSLQPLDMEMVEAGECRHELDWIWGINVSRALMDIYRRAYGERRILSAGRVQTPTLVYAVNQILERRLHVPLPLFIPKLRADIGGVVVDLEPVDPPFESAIEAKKFLEKVKLNPIGRVVKVDRREEVIEPPPPFNLPDLQSEAYRIYKMTPYAVQKIAEDLYLDALISYPRTNSQKLPPTLDNRAILSGLRRIPMYSKLVDQLLAETRGVLRPHNGPKDDPAHPAIYPTGEVPTKPLSPRHRRVYDLIVRRYLATFSKPARVRRVSVVIDIHGRKFLASSVRVVDQGWFKYYPFSKPSETPYELYARPWQSVKVVQAKIVVRYTAPPPRPTRIGLLKWMEEVGIGTEATRAEIIETLYRRRYLYTVKGGAEVSDLGIAIAFILSKYVPELTSPELTRKFEVYLRDIQMRRARCVDILEEAKKTILEALNKFIRSGNEIAKEFDLYIHGKNIGGEERCRICGRRAVGEGLCLFHLEAYRRIVKAYDRWKEAGYTWNQYLEKLAKLRSTGMYVRDVCNYLLRNVGTSTRLMPRYS